MYDASVTRRMVEQVNIDRGHRKQPELVYHTPSQIEYSVAHLRDLYDPEEKRLTRSLTVDEQTFITNERVLCALDFRTYWLPNYARIVDWRKQPSSFVPNVAQNIVLDCWAEAERQGLAIWMQQLKARRLGVSTISELNVTHRFQFQPYANCVLASADPDKTVEMAGMLKYALEQQPWWLLPAQTKISRSIPVEHGEMHSTLAIQAGNQFNGVARGSSPNVVHLSELCEWQDAESLVEGALLPAILDTPDTFGILESTASGPGWWKRFWQQTKRDWSRGTARIRPVFLPWFVGTDIYPTPADMRKRPIPANWVPTDRTIAHAERARQYVLSDPLLFTYLAKMDHTWTLPRPQMWWYEMGYETAREGKSLNIFLAEYCGDDMEAFQSSNIPVIDTEILIGYQARTRIPESVYTIVGPDIPPALITPTRHWRSDRPTITIDTGELLPRYPVKYQLVPVRFEGYSTFDETMKLLVWEPPADGHVYGVGIDCAEGVGQDNSTIEVLREATVTREPGQVAEWASNYVTAFQLWPLLCAVGTWYSTPSPMDGIVRQCRLAIETWANGSAAQHELQKRGWLNFHPWMYAGDARKPKRPGETNKIGVMTNAWFRSSMQDMFLTCLGEEAIDLPSPYLIDELTTLERAVGVKKASAADDAHDDRFMGLGIVLFSLHMNKPPSKQFQRKRINYAPGLAGEMPVVHPTFVAPTYAIGTAFKPGMAHGVLSNARGQWNRLGPMHNPNVPKRYQ